MGGRESSKRGCRVIDNNVMKMKGKKGRTSVFWEGEKIKKGGIVRKLREL